MKTAIILYTANYCARIKYFYGVNYLISHGYNVQFWDLSEITCKESLTPASTPGLIVHKIDSFASFEEMVKKSKKKSIFFTIISYADFSYRVYRILSEQEVTLATSVFGVVPFSTHKKWSLKRFCDGIKNRVWIKFYSYNYLNSANYILRSCHKGNPPYKIDETSVTIYCNSSDYENYKESLSQERIVNDRYVVFLDQYLPFHNDFRLMGAPSINHHKYYNALNDYFNTIEKKYNCSVVIAAHPAALRYKSEDFFNGRLVVFDKVANLVAHSLGVIAHDSTAISYVVMAKKPLIVLLSDELRDYIKRGFCISPEFIEVLGCSYDDLDSNMKYEFPTIDEEKYNNYLFDYLTNPESMDYTNGEIISKVLND